MEYTRGEILLLVLTAAALALLAGCDDGQAAEITAQIEADTYRRIRSQHEINAKLASAHAALLTNVQQSPVSVSVDGEPHMLCRPIRRKP